MAFEYDVYQTNIITVNRTIESAKYWEPGVQVHPKETQIYKNLIVRRERKRIINWMKKPKALSVNNHFQNMGDFMQPKLISNILWIKE